MAKVLTALNTGMINFCPFHTVFCFYSK